MNEIEQRQLGASGLVVPALGVGTMSWGENLMGYGRSYSRDDITQAYRACLDAGLNFFDTAEMYGRGESERILGECRRQDGRPIIIASKFAPASLMAPIPARWPARALLNDLDQCLLRLGVECIDLYQIHLPTASRRVDALMDVLAEAVRAGKVRAVGVCNYNAALMRRAHARLAGHGIALASNQVQYSLLYRYPETNGVLAACRELNVALIAYAPLAQGVLSGKYRQGTIPTSTFQRSLWRLGQLDLFGEMGETQPLIRRLRAKPRLLQREQLEPLFEVLEEIARGHNRTIAQVTLNWLLTKNADVIPIPGAKNAQQARANAGALGWHLTQDECSRISQAELAAR